MELLSPAGNIEKLFYAYEYGADAAYIGLKNFSLRAKADNFNNDEYNEIIKIKKDKKLYAALNIYFHDNDIKLLEKEEDQIARDRESREDEYRAAHAAGRESAKKAIIRKLETLKIHSQGVASRFKTCYSIYQTTIGLIAVKENQAFFEKLGVGSLVMKMDINELQTFMICFRKEIRKRRYWKLQAQRNYFTTRRQKRITLKRKRNWQTAQVSSLPC